MQVGGKMPVVPVDAGALRVTRHRVAQASLWRRPRHATHLTDPCARAAPRAGQTIKAA
jgi:hypothetical protein